MEHSTADRSLRIPGDNERALVVGAVDSENPAAIQPFSSRGPTADGRTKPDIVAPDGYSTLTAFILETEILDPFHGTSAAAPIVGGAAALIKQIHPDWSGDQIKAALLSAALDLGERGRDNTFGAGRLDLRAFWPDAGIPR
jgi:subtilisin family serine protease